MLTVDDLTTTNETTTKSDATKKPEKQMPDLSMHYGSSEFYQHWLPLWNGKKLVYTEGIKDLAEKVGAYWLIDAIASHQSRGLHRITQGMQFWTIEVFGDRSCVLRCVKDSGHKPCVEQRIEYTDFPRTPEPFRIWVENDTIYLPQER